MPLLRLPDAAQQYPLGIRCQFQLLQPRSLPALALDAEVLLLDDLGAQRVTDWVEDTVTSIVTYRCNNRKPLHRHHQSARSGRRQRHHAEIRARQAGIPRTLAEHIGARARSRLFEMCTVVRMPLVEDYRVRKARTF